MLSPPEPVRLAVPPAPSAPAAPGFPLVATLAPVAVSVVLWLVTSSPFVLVFALLGPVVAVASVVDGRRHRRRAARREDERMATALARLEVRARTAADTEVGRLRRLVPAIGETPRWDAPTPIVLAGRGERPSGVELSGGEDLEEPWRARVDELQARLRSIPDAPCPREAGVGVAVVGPPVAAAATARAVLLQLLAQCPPDRTALRIDPVETWATALPHAVTAGDRGAAILESGDERLRVTWHGQRPAGAVVLAIEPGPGTTGGGALAITRATARLEAARLRAIADGLGLRPALASLPERVPLAGLLHETSPVQVDGVGGGRRPGLVAAIGRDADGPVLVDLVAEGPHAVVAGTTGSGKSELLVSWVLAMAHGRSSEEVAFVLVDFKGGAAFAPLRALPHVLGVLSDLDG